MSLQQAGAQTTLDAMILQLRAHHGTLLFLPVSYVMLMAVADGTDELLHGQGDISNSIPADL